MPVHFGFRDTLKLGAHMMKLGVIGKSTPGGRKHFSPGSVLDSARAINDKNRLKTFTTFNGLKNALLARQGEFSILGYHEVSQLYPILDNAFTLNPGLRAHLIVHNSDRTRMKRIELELPGGVVETMWTDS